VGEGRGVRSRIGRVGGSMLYRCGKKGCVRGEKGVECGT
jgi:hypothetical protein